MNNDAFFNNHKEFYSRANRERAGKANAVRRVYIYMADGRPETYASLAEKTGLTDGAVRSRVDKMRKLKIPLTIEAIKELYK